MSTKGNTFTALRWLVIALGRLMQVLYDTAEITVKLKLPPPYIWSKHLRSALHMSIP